MDVARGKKFDLKVNPVDIEKSGEVIRITLVTVGPNDGLIIGQAATLFNLSESAIHKHLRRHDIVHKKIVTGKLQLLKNSGVVNSKAIHAIFIPRYGLRELMRVIDTEEAKAAYHTLFDDAEALLRVKPENEANKQRILDLEASLLESAGQLKAALDRAAIDKAKLRIQDQRIAELEAELRASLGENQKTLGIVKSLQDEFERVNAKLQASIDFIENKDKGKRKCRQSVVEFEFAGVNIFEGPQYVARVKKLEKAEMNEREQNVFALQKGISSIRGIAGSMEQRSEKLGIANPEVRDALKQLSQASDDAYHKLIPEAGKIFGLRDGESISYLN